MDPEKSAADEVRFPAILPVRMQFRRADGTVIDDQVWPGKTRDVSTTGMSVFVHGSPELIEKLQAHATELRTEIDVEVGRRTLRMVGDCKWVKPSGKSGRALLGVEYLDARPTVAQTIAAYARRVQERPVVVRMAVGSLVVVLVVGAILYWQGYSARHAVIERVERQLQQATILKHDAALQLERTQREVIRLTDSADTKDEVLAAKEEELDRYRAKLEARRKRVGRLSVSLKDLKGSALPRRGRSAIYHFDRARNFADEDDNLAAALLEFERTVRIDSSFADAHLEIGTINELYGRNRRAIAAYGRYLELRSWASDAAEVRAKVAALKRDSGARGSSKPAPASLASSPPLSPPPPPPPSPESALP